MSLSKKVVLTVSGYKISLSDSLQFYQNDQLKLIFEINKYGIDVESSFTHKTLMPLQPLTATLFIETPLGVDSIESANIEDNAVTFYLTSNQTQHIGTSTMQIKLTDDDGCQITLPSFTFEVQKNIYDNAVHVSGILLADENGNALSDENGNTINATITTETSKQIKDFTLKTGVSGQEDILVQDNGVTKRIKSSELIDIVDLSSYATKDELNNKADVSSIPSKTSQLTNDSGYMTSVPLEYVTETELNGKGYLTEHQDISMKADKSEIPSLEGYATETFVTNKIAEASLSGGEVDLSGYATKDELSTKADISSIPTKTSQLANDSGFLTSVPSEYITESKLNAKGYLTEHQDITGKADKSYVNAELAKKSDTTHTHSYNDLTDKPTIPSVDNLATKDELVNGLTTKADVSHTHDQYLTEQDLSDYALKTEIPTVPTKTSQLTNDSGFINSIPSEYITETELDAKGYLTEHIDISEKANISDLSTVATSGDYSDLINKPTIPIVDVDKNYVDTQLATKANVDDIPNLNDYALKTEIPTVPTNTSELTNDSGFITTIPTEYVTETELNTGLSDYQTKTDNTLTTTSKTVVGAINELNRIKIIALTQSEYDRLVSKDANTVYLITD